MFSFVEADLFGNIKWLKRVVEAFMLPLLILVLLPSCGQHKQAPTLTVTVLDVGQGDSILLQSPSGHTVLIDGGGKSDEVPDTMSQDVGETVVLPALRSKGIGKIDVLVLTHPHSDHVGGLVAVVRDEKIGCVLDGHVQPYPSAIYAAFSSTSKLQVSRHKIQAPASFSRAWQTPAAMRS